MGTKTAVHVLAALTTLLPPPVAAQGRVVPPPDVNDSAQLVIPGPRYRAGPLHRFLLGNGWRDLWILPLEVRPLPIDTFAGGLTPEREGGNKQSITLHFLDEQGKGWVFRSMDKYPAEKLSSELAGTPVGALIQDQIGALHAAGQFVVPPLLDAIGALHVDPVLYVMPDHERLGDYRRTFAGMIGALERKPNEGENDTPGFAGSRHPAGPDRWLGRRSPRWAA